MPLFKQIESLFRTGTAIGLTDGQLLDRFVQRRDDETAEAAFTTLVDRHGPMVLRVCRQVLGHEHDAWDSSQATFLVLARRAGSIGRRESVGSWLHGVALRVAAKARVAAARRTAHERRGAEMAIGRMVGETAGPDEGRELWTILHEELDRLPETFRAPIVLCYLEGLTQEQAAARLRAPLGTIQSRLARGRSKLKARLEQRGVDVSAAIPAGASAGLPPPPAPPAWAEATVRLGMQFARGSAAGSAAAGLAEEFVRAIVGSRMKAAFGMILFAALLVGGASTWAAKQGQKESPTVLPKNATAITPKAAPLPRAAPPSRSETRGTVRRTVRGIVRDEQGRPMAGAWIGSGVKTMNGDWNLIRWPHRIREATVPYRDEEGRIIPPGQLGKYFEYRDHSGKWLPIHPDDVRRWDPIRNPRYVLSHRQAAATRKSYPNGLLEVRTFELHGYMLPLDPESSELAPRTDSLGRFAVPVTFSLPRSPTQEIRFASEEFERQAVRIVRAEDPDRPIQVALRAVRSVRASVIETPNESPARACFMACPLRECHRSRTPERRSGRRSGRAVGCRSSQRFLVALRSEAARVGSRPDCRPGGTGQYSRRPRRIASWRWSCHGVRVRSSCRPSASRASPGCGMLGQPAAEIEAIDLDGKPVKLADHRGKVVVLMFWGTWYEPWPAMLERLADLRRRLRDEPLVLLALHDASITSLEAYHRAIVPFLDRYAKRAEAPCRLLLDRPQIGKGIGP